uniref:Autophagy-related protein 11 C-terminal domain-containing protein n=1 Tax=Ditylenchus dipsaci TaxID=166011 RepID=A0A915D3G6_9BILA
MFHIFYVNKGYMLVLEPPALGSVYELQQCIYDATNVEVQEQVLFLSGGESVMNGETLSAYLGAGTDTNPVYLVRRVPSADRESVSTPERDGINNLYQTWVSSVEKLDKSATSSSTTAEYTRLGKYGMQVSDTIFKFCAKVVSEHQHLNQGWMAVISNLDDNINKIQKKMDRSMHQCQRLATMRDKGYELLNGFDQVLETLNMITIPGQLISSMSSIAGASTAAPNYEFSQSVAGGAVEDMTLYKWIASKDTVYSLNSLVEHVTSHLQKTDDTDLRDAKLNFDAVKELVKKTDYRDIRGIDKRLAMLDTKLNFLEESHLIMKDLANHIIQPTIQDSNANMAAYQRARVEEFNKMLSEFNNYALCFIDSKLELLKNICQRFAGWVRQAYERLQQANKRMILFDDKFTGLRQRLDLVRQIKEAPIMYVTAVAEVIRREALKKEFGHWISTCIDKCSSFVQEENKMRSEFYGKLEKHFLRTLFYGMADVMPDFTPMEPHIDKTLPKVTIEHFKELRKTFPDMQELLKVTTPQIYTRLSITDPSAPQMVMAQSQMAGLRREESFFVREKTHNIDAMNRNFPSTTWLSEENIEMSPANNFLLTTRAGFSSNTSLNNMESNMPTPQNSNLCMSLELYLLRTPILLPRAGLSSSERSSHFSTPDDNFGSFGKYVRNSFPRSPPKICRPKSLQRRTSGAGVSSSVQMHLAEQQDQILESLENLPATLSEEFFAKCAFTRQSIADIVTFLITLKQSVEDYKVTIREETEQNLATVKAALKEDRLRNVEISNQLKTDSEKVLNEKSAEWESSYEGMKKELSQVVEHERYLRKEKEKELEEQRNLANKLNEDLLSVMKAKDDLHADLMKAEQERRLLSEQLQLESSIDYLAIELKAVEQLLKRELTSDEIQQIKAEIEKRKASQGKTQEEIAVALVEPTTMIRAEYEKAYKNKMAFIVKGVEEKKNKEIALLRDEIESELRLQSDIYIKKMKQKIGELEDKVKFLESTEHQSFPQPSASPERAIMVDSAMQVSDPKLDFKGESLMQESCMVLSNAAMDQSIAIQQQLPPEEPRPASCNQDPPGVAVILQASGKNSAGTSSKGSDDSDVEIANVLSIYSRGTQTKIRMRDMRMMIALNDVYEGCSVLIMWDNVHNTYVVFCTNPTLYVVKESCMLRLGVSPLNNEQGATTRRNWMFAAVNGIETCQIKKEKNRYNLPMNTRFYRVSVEPLPMDTPSSQSSSTSISTSRR